MILNYDIINNYYDIKNLYIIKILIYKAIKIK